MGSKSTFGKRRKTKKSSCNSRLIVKARPIKETRKETKPAPRKKAQVESPKPMREPITLEDFLLPPIKEEDELKSSSCNQISILGHSSPSYSEDSDGGWVPPTMPPPMDDDDQCIDPKSHPDEKEYLSDELLNENDFINDPYFY